MGCGMNNILLLTPFQERLRKTKATNKQWLEYEEKLKSNYAENNETKLRSIYLNDKKMEYEFAIKGKEPVMGYPLYICLHDGEVSRTAYNTSEYNKMKAYYLQSIDTGICLATRGVTDLSNLHCIDESYLMYEELIRKMIILERIDPNKVYLVGVGLGANAVYQIATKISDRFAAVSVNTGHSFGINVKNLFNIPIQIQVGENDNLFDRNKDAVKTYERLIALNKDMHLNSSYASVECNIHCNRNHNLKDNQIQNEFQPVKNDPINWMKGEVASELRNTNAISFLKRHTRNPYPKRLIWDLTKISNYILSDVGERRDVQGKNHQLDKNNYNNYNNSPFEKKETISDRNTFIDRFPYGKNKTITESETNNDFNVNPTEVYREQREMKMRIAMINKNTVSTINLNQHYYWLEIGNKTLQELGVVEVIAQFNKESNTITIETPIRYLRILLCEEMVDLDKEVFVDYLGVKKAILLSRNYRTEKRVIKERGDYTYIFQACIVIESKDLSHYKINQYEEPFNEF